MQFQQFPILDSDNKPFISFSLVITLLSTLVFFLSSIFTKKQRQQSLRAGRANVLTTVSLAPASCSNRNRKIRLSLANFYACSNLTLSYNKYKKSYASFSKFHYDQVWLENISSLHSMKQRLLDLKITSSHHTIAQWSKLCCLHLYAALTQPML